MSQIHRRTLLKTTAASFAGSGLANLLDFGRFSLFAADTAPKATADTPWPPNLNGAEKQPVTLKSPDFLSVPTSVAEALKKPGAAEFTVAKTSPVVDLAIHGNLGSEPATRRLWSSWGDICVARDGRVYVASGDHGHDVEGDARCFLYRWDPKAKTFDQIVDMNKVVPPRSGQPAWSKVHAKIDEGADGKIYFSCTLNDGQRASNEKVGWNEQLPGGQLYQYDPASGRVSVYASLPPKRCTATSLMDQERNVWWCNLEANGGDALWALDMATKKPKFVAPAGSMGFNRNFALGHDGAIYFNGVDPTPKVPKNKKGKDAKPDAGENKVQLWRYDPVKGTIAPTKSSFVGSPGMRCSSHESKGGNIYGITHGSSQLFRYSTKADELKMLGTNWLNGSYTAVCAMSPDDRFLYYLPGSHGGAFKDGTPVVQYEVASGKRKVIAFLAPAIEKLHNYVPAGTYGIKLSADGSTLYANLNGHPADAVRPANMKPIGFGLCSLVAVHIPESERK